MTHNGTKKLYLTGAVAALGAAIVIAVFATAQSAGAISSSGPHAADYGNSARYALQNTADISVRTSTVPVYYAANPGTIQVTANSFSFEGLTGVQSTVSFNGRAGVNSDTTFPLSGFVLDPNSGYWVALIRADLINNGSPNRIVNYRLSVPAGGLLGTYAANGNNSAIANQNRCDSRDSSGCGRYYNYSLPFGTSCQVPGNTSVSARIYDGDNGNSGVQPTNFRVSIFDETDNVVVAHNRTGSEANGGVATYTFTVKPYHKYRFRVDNVYSNNVMQINLPYDGIFYFSDCRTLEQTDRLYGSWGEYGVMATGTIRGIGSGSAFAGRGLSHATNCSFTFLTIANATNSNCRSTGANDYGRYVTARKIPDVAGSYPVTSATSTLSGNVDVSSLNGTYRVSGPITITGGTLPAGRTVVINTYNPVSRTYQDVTIAGDIRYTSAALTASNQIPQLVILANNISIRDNVQQIDAWLSAEGTLNTCSNVNRTAITINNCNRLLTVNGPVMAREVQLWRTAGSGNDTASGDPAEVFNLRPDAYLWGISQSAQSGRLSTVYERELPPRF